VRRQKSANSEHHNPRPETPKSLSARYAELLKLREAVSKTQSDLNLSAGVERVADKENRALPYH
jgi:hypothetical protein